MRSLFKVIVRGLTYGYFEGVSGLAGSVEVIEDRDGSSPLAPRKSPGLASFDNVTLRQGMTTNTELWDWWQETYNAVRGTGSPPAENFRRDVLILQLDRAGNTVGSWKLLRAWVAHISTEDWDASASEHQVLSAELAHEGIERVAVPSVV